MKSNCTIIYIRRPLVAALAVGVLCVTLVNVTSMIAKAKSGTKIFVINTKTNEEESEEKE